MFLLCSFESNDPQPFDVSPIRSMVRDRTPRLRDWGSPVQSMIRTARCQACGHAAALPVAQLMRRFDGRTPIADLAARLVCSSCGGRDAIETSLSRLCEPGCPRQRG